MKRIIAELNPYRFYIAAVLVFAFITVVMTLRIPVLTGQAVDCIVSAQNVDTAGLFHVLAEMGVSIAVTIIAQYLMNRINNHIAYSLTRSLRGRAFDTLSRLSVGQIDKHPHGDYISRIITDADVFSDGLLLGFSQLFSGVLTIILTIVFMARISFLLAMIVVVLTPVSVFVAKYISSRSYRFFQTQADDRGVLTDFVDERIEGQKLLKSFSYMDQTIADFEKMNACLTESSIKATFFSSLPNPSSRFVNNLIYMSVGVAGAFAAMNGHLTIGGLTAFLAYSAQYAKPFNEITGVVTEMGNAIVCAGRLFELMDEPRETETGDGTLGRVAGRIGFSDVSFSYRKNEPLMEHISLAIHKGERIAIVGPTGAGKTTLINLLMRFYDIDDGTITIDERDVRTVTRDDLRAHFGMVLQETWLAEGTVADNIKMGHPEATMDDVIRAAEQTKAHEFIRKLPQKYETFLTTDGGVLSQGQKQLLCITRVMLSLPPMLILDEATSSIDTRTE
ncbi:MAG: ABC transporter ATP-binding protein, partial [Lachnospiraceae bacterium]|nr:ABC transporter ATP-binding protein [Lachnospiraceae bacterium]